MMVDNPFDQMTHATSLESLLAKLKKLSTAEQLALLESIDKAIKDDPGAGALTGLNLIRNILGIVAGV